MIHCGFRYVLIGALVIIALIYIERANASADISVEPAGTDIHEILKTSSGEYFIGTNGGLSLWIGHGQYRNYTVYDGLVANLIYDLAEDDKGRVWVATEGGISIFTKGNFINFPCGSGFMRSGVIRLKWKNGKMIAHTASEENFIFEGDNITKIPPEPEILPAAKKKKSIKSHPTPVRIYSRQPDYEGDEWKKVLGQGRAAHYPTNYIRFQTPIKNNYTKNISEKPVDNIMAMIPARNSGSFWFVTNEKKLKHFDISKGKIADPNFDIDEDVQVTGLARTSDNYLWILAENRIFRIDDRESEISSPKAIPYKGVGIIRTMIEEEKTTWFLAENGLLKYKDNTLEAYTYRDGLPPGPILAIQRDSENNVWAGGPGGFGRLILGEGRKNLNDMEKAFRRVEQASEKILESVQIRKDWTVSINLTDLIIFSALTGIVSFLWYRRRFGSMRRDVKRDIPFAPVKNPYIVGNPIRSSEMFFGRKDDFFFIRQKLKGDEKNLVIVFCGERRSGKTSILFQIMNGRLGDGFIPVLFDMQSIPLVKSEADFLQKMAEETLSATGHPEWLDEFQWQGQDVNPFQTYETLLNRITEIHPSDYLLYLFDEYEIIGEKAREGSLSHDLIFFFANLLENRNVSFIFTGSKRIEDQFEEFWKILIGKSVYKKISFLSVRDTERLITEPVQDSLFYEDGVVELIAEYSAGSPFYTQVICQNLADLANMKRTNYIDREDLEAIIEEVLDNPLPQMIYFWDNLPYEEKLVLSLLATALEKRNRSLPPKALLGLIQKEKIPVSLNYQDMLSVSERLFHKEILLKDSRGRYRFRIGLFRRWIGKDHSIWEVIHNSRVGN